MTSFPIALLKDDFTNNTQDPLWAASAVTGSATKAETGGQAVLTLPNATAGSHAAYYRSAASYDLTGDGFVWNIGTMVATGVAATAQFQLFIDGNNQLYWRQLSNAITARYTLAGVDTQLFTATWSSSTYKYLRIRESGGTIFFDSSSNGTSWTNRASVANPFAVTSLFIQMLASCGNVASPGSLKLDDVNLILPAPSSTWRETTADWSISNRLRSVTLASDGGKQGVVVTADTMDSSRNLGGTVRYFAGPLGSSSGGFLQLTEYASLALAEASAFPIPINGRVDLPVMIDARYMRLYHRSTDASAHTIYEYLPRRLVQTDDLEAENIDAMVLKAGTVTADKLFVVSLSAITASMGTLHMDGPIDITSGSLTGGGSTVTLDSTGLGMVGPAFTWNLTNLSPVTVPRANMVQWSKSSGSQAASIAGSDSAQLLALADRITLAVPLTSTVSAGIDISSTTVKIENATTFLVQGDNIGSADFEITTALNAANSITAVRGTLQVARSSGSAQFGVDGTAAGSALSVANNATATPFSNTRNFSGLIIISETAVNGNAAMFLVDGGGNITLIGQAGATWSVTSGTASKTNVYLVSGAVTIENKLGSTASYNVLALRTRTT